MFEMGKISDIRKTESNAFVEARNALNATEYRRAFGDRECWFEGGRAWVDESGRDWSIGFDCGGTCGKIAGETPLRAVIAAVKAMGSAW